MLERIGINLSLSFIYILLFRHLITPTVIVNTDFQVIILYFLLALLISIFLEAWHYLIIDLIEYPKVTLTVIAIGMIVCLFIKTNLYMLFCLGYVVIMMLTDFYRTYKIQQALIFIEKKVFKTLIAPPVVLTLIWSIVLIGFALLVRVDADVLLFMFFVICSIILFSIGYLISTNGKVYKLSFLTKTIQDRSNKDIHIKISLYLIVFFECIVVLNGIISAIRFTTVNNYGNFLLSLRIGILSNKLVLGSLFSYTGVFAIVLFLYMYTHLLNCKKNKTILVVQGIIAFSFGLINSGRSYIYIIIIPLLIIYYYSSENNYKKIIKIIKYLFIVILIFLLYSYFKSSENILQIYDDLKLYLFGSIDGFLQWFTGGFKYLDGKNSFRFFIEIMNAFGLTNIDTNLVEKSVLIFNGTSSTNVYTIFKYYINDFGVVYCLLIVFLLGLVYGYLMKKVTRKFSVKNFVFLSIMYYPLIFSFFSDQYLSLTSTWIQIYFWLFIIDRFKDYLFSNKKNVINEKQLAFKNSNLKNTVKVNK